MSMHSRAGAPSSRVDARTTGFRCDRRTFVAGLLACASGVQAAASTTPTLTSASQQGVAHKFGPGDAPQTGFCVEYMRALSAQDPELQFRGLERHLPLLRVERELSTSDIDVFFGLLKTPDRIQRFRYVEQPPLCVARHRVAVRAADREASAVTCFEEIRALGARGTVLATRGSAYTSHLLRQSGLRVDDGATDNLQNLRKLARGRGRFFYQSEASLRQLIRAQGLQDEVSLLPVVFAEAPLLVAHSCSLNTEIVARLTRAMNELERLGAAKRLRDAYEL